MVIYSQKRDFWHKKALFFEKFQAEGKSFKQFKVQFDMNDG